MDISIQRKIDRMVGVPLCWVFSCLSLFSERVPEGYKPYKILVILLSEMGSLVLARPMFDLLREKYPKARIYVLCFKRNKPFLEILDVMPSEDILTVREESLGTLIQDTISFMWRAHRERIDTVIDCELFSRVSSIYSFLSGSKLRVGFAPYTQEGLYRGSFINRPVLYNPYHHISLQFINLVEAIESNQVPRLKRRMEGTDFKLPKVRIEKAEKEQYATKLEADFPSLSGKSLVLLYPSGGLLPIRAWPLENFCRISEAFLRENYAVGIIGMKSDRDQAERILRHCSSKFCVDMTGYTHSVRELVTLFHLASLLITNDGGPGHFASITDLPCLVLFGPETPALYGPLSHKCIKLHVPLSCSPCLTAYNHRNSPCDGDNQCLKSIRPEEVLDQAHQLLAAAERVERNL